MSFHSRARALQKLSGKGYQFCHQKVQDNDVKARELTTKWNWSINRADVYLFDPSLDPDYAAGTTEEH